MLVAPDRAPRLGDKTTRDTAQRIAGNWWLLLLNGLLLIVAGILIFSVDWTVRSLATFIGVLFIVQGVVEALTDNRNRTAQEVRHAFTRNGGNLGETGSTLWMFQRKGVIVVDKAVAPDEDVLLDLALQGGAEDLADSESSWDIVTDPQDFKAVEAALREAGVQASSAEISLVPSTSIPVEGGEARHVLQLIDALEELDDVQNVYANFDIPEEVMASL